MSDAALVGWLVLAMPLLAVGVFLVARGRVPARVPVHATDRRIIDKEIELELSDGRVYRSSMGYTWYRFPSGDRADWGLESWLANEDDRLERLDKWSKS